MGKRLFLLAVVSAVVAVAASPAWGAFPGGNGELVVATPNGLKLLNPSSGRARAICTNAMLCGRPMQPRFSPNGQAIALVDSARSRLVVLAPDGSCLWCLVGAPLTSQRGSRPAFTSRGWAVTLAAKGLSRVSLTTGGASQIVRGRVSDAVWSSRGLLAFVRAGWVWVGRPGHGKFRRLARGRSPSFSPNGLSRAFASGSHIWIISVKGGAQRQLARGAAPAWSPNARQIAYIGRGGTVQIIAARGGRSRRFGRVRGTSLDWQPLVPAAKLPCRPPKGSTVLASTPEATVYRSSATYGCMRALGIPRPLDQVAGGGGTVLTGQPALAGRFAAFKSEQCVKGACRPSSLEVADLGDGKISSLDPSLSVDGFGVDSSGFTAWHQTQSSVRQSIDSISCPSAILCVAGDGVDDILTSRDPTGGSNAWSIAPLTPRSPAYPPAVTGLSCPSTSLCVAAESDGELLTSTDPTGGPSAWTTQTIARDSFSQSLGGVSCPTTSLCVAFNGGFAVFGPGDVFTSANPTGGPGAWTSATVGTASAVSCPSTSLCVAVGFVSPGAINVLTSTNPTGGASAWSSAQLPNNAGPTAISCPSTSLCVATNVGGNVFASTNPTGGTIAWTSAHVSAASLGLDAISCPSTSLCVAGDNDGNILTSTNPTGGASAWTSVHVSASGVSAIFCPSTSLCVAGDSNGNIITSIDPTGGPGAWTSVPVDIPGCALPRAFPCIAEQLYAHDENGTRPIDSAPPGSGNVIGNLSLSGDTLTLSWTHNSAQQQLELR